MNILYENSSFHIFHDCIRLRHPIQPTPQHNTSSPTLLLPLLDNTTYIYQYFNQIAKNNIPDPSEKKETIENKRVQKRKKKMVCSKCAKKLKSTQLATPDVKRRSEMYYGSSSSTNSSDKTKGKSTLGNTGIGKVGFSFLSFSFFFLSSLSVFGCLPGYGVMMPILYYLLYDMRTDT